jgi:hypothetical protein
VLLSNCGGSLSQGIRIVKRLSGYIKKYLLSDNPPGIPYGHDVNGDKERFFGYFMQGYEWIQKFGQIGRNLIAFPF